MKFLLSHLFLIAGMALLGGKLTAQTSEQALPITVGYWGNLATQPGIKVGAQLTLKDWQKEKGDKVKGRKLFVRPEIGVYNRHRNNTNLLVGAEAGIQLQREGRKFFHSVGLGLGYLGRSQILSIRFSLGDGSIVGKEREWRSYILTTLNYTFGSEITSRLAWYGKASVGPALSFTREPTTMAFLEVGLRINLFQ